MALYVPTECRSFVITSMGGRCALQLDPYHRGLRGPPRSSREYSLMVGRFSMVRLSHTAPPHMLEAPLPHQQCLAERYSASSAASRLGNVTRFCTDTLSSFAPSGFTHEHCQVSSTSPRRCVRQPCPAPR